MTAPRCASAAPIGMPPSFRPSSASAIATSRSRCMSSMYNGARRDHAVNVLARRLLSAATPIVLGVGLAAVLESQPAPHSLTLLAREGRRLLPLVAAGDQELVALDDLAGAFQLAVQESLGAITVSYKGKTIVLTPDQTLASVSGRLISLPAALVRRNAR